MLCVTRLLIGEDICIFTILELIMPYLNGIVYDSIIKQNKQSKICGWFVCVII